MGLLSTPIGARNERKRNGFLFLNRVLETDSTLMLLICSVFRTGWLPSTGMWQIFTVSLASLARFNSQPTVWKRRLTGIILQSFFRKKMWKNLGIARTLILPSMKVRIYWLYRRRQRWWLLLSCTRDFWKSSFYKTLQVIINNPCWRLHSIIVNSYQNCFT